MPFSEGLNRMLKEPQPSDFDGSVLIQGGETRLSLNLNSGLFYVDAVASDDHTFCLLTAKPALDEAITQKITVTGTFTTGTAQYYLRSPAIFSEEKPEENKGSVQYTTFWPAGYTGRVVDGVFEVLDGEGNAVARSGDRVQIEARVLYGATSGIPWQLYNELPGGCFQPYLIVDNVTR